MITVFLTKALLCLNAVCYPALVGRSTPTGTFALQHTEVSWSGYGGDVLVFKQDATYVWAIHRTWLGAPQQRRTWRLAHGTARERRITMGCINVTPYVYEKLTNETTVRIEP